jgi:hypothetical protein
VNIVLNNLRLDNLEDRLLASMHWIDRNLSQFRFVRNGELPYGTLKALAELAVAYAWLKSILGRVPLSHSIAAVEPTLERWRAFLICECKNPSYAEMPRKRPSQALAIILPYLALRSCGDKLAYYEGTLAKLRRWNYPGSIELVPYRVLDYEYFTWKSGWRQKEPNWNSLYRRTSLGKAKTLSYFSIDDDYAVTHTLFYLTDFGLRQLPLSKYEVDKINDVVNSLVIHYWRLCNWDLLGELLIVLELLHSSNSWIYSGASGSFQNAWLADGAVPPDCNGNDTGTIANAETSVNVLPEYFRRHYHTTLVGALYCASAVVNRRG